MARKLFNASAVEPPTTKFCDPYCDNTKTAYGICPYMCNGFCPPLCVPLFEPPAPPPPPPPPPPIASIHKSHRLSLALTVSLSVLATAFFLFTCYTIYKLCSNWRRSRRSRSNRPEEDGGLADDFLDEEHGPIVDHPIWYIRTIGLQPSVISAITRVKYKTGDGLIEGTDCSVCLNEFEDGETLRLLPKCNHAFHIPCIDTWLRSHTNCPMCRAGIVNNAAAPLSSPEPVVHNSGLAEDNPLEMSENSIEVSENESSPGTEDARVTRSQSGLKIDEDADRVLPMRRSVSFDSLSASMISAAVATAFAGQSDGNSDISKESTQQTAGSSNIQRSVSCSAKVFLSRHSSRNRNSQ